MPWDKGHFFPTKSEIIVFFSGWEAESRFGEEGGGDGVKQMKKNQFANICKYLESILFLSEQLTS